MPASPMPSLHDAAERCLAASSPDRKCALTHALWRDIQEGSLSLGGDSTSPEQIDAGRPERPRLVPARALASRGIGTPQGRAAFVHAIAHIEFNAINLAWDAVYRFRDMPEAFYRDWAGVADDEARHFALLRTRLRALGHDYGDFDAHNGLWEMAQLTAHSCLARMALVPRVLEARGLDVTPDMIVRLRAVRDEETAEILETILREEVGHVAVGSRWFRWLCERDGVDPHLTFRALLDRHARGAVRSPFNLAARDQAGFDACEMEMLHAIAGART